MPPSSLTTRCVHCHTVFRVTAAQLQAHGGQVRCGRCMQTFNALAALAPEAAAPVEESPPFAAAAVVAAAPAEPEPPAPPEAAVEQPPKPVAAEAVAEVLQELLPDPPSVAGETAASAVQAETATVLDAAAGPQQPIETTNADNPFGQFRRC